MEVVSGDRDCFLLFFGEFDFCWVEVGVEFAADGESGCGGGVGNEVDHGLECFQWSAAPVEADAGEETVFDLVPFAGAGWIVADMNVKAGCFGEASQFMFPQPGAGTVGSASVSGDQYAGGISCFPFPATRLRW